MYFCAQIQLLATMSLKSLYDSVFHVYKRYDLTPWDRLPKDIPQIYGVYHIFCAPGWQSLVKDQMESLRSSGLWAATKKLFVSCIISKDSDMGELRSIMGPDEKWEVIAVGKDKTKFEFPALNFIQGFCRDHKCLVYYFHTKGISLMSTTNHSRDYRKFKRNVTAWRKMMEYFVFDRWQVAVNVLMEGYDTYGTLKLDPPYTRHSHYSGNFWWARSEYLTQLAVLDEKKRKDRFKAEMWILSGRGRFFSTFDNKTSLYGIYMPKQLYLSCHPTSLNKLRFIMSYNVDKLNRHLVDVELDKKKVDKYRTNG